MSETKTDSTLTQLFYVLPWYLNAAFFCYGLIDSNAYLMAFSGVWLIVCTILMKGRLRR